MSEAEKKQKLISMIHDGEGIGHLFDEYSKEVGVGNCVKQVRNDPTFTYGLEYGALLAFWYIATTRTEEL